MHDKIKKIQLRILTGGVSITASKQMMVMVSHQVVIPLLTNGQVSQFHLTALPPKLLVSIRKNILRQSNFWENIQWFNLDKQVLYGAVSMRDVITKMQVE